MTQAKAERLVVDWLTGDRRKGTLIERIVAAVAAEREACAREAEKQLEAGHDPYCCDIISQNIADAIRARSN